MYIENVLKDKILWLYEIIHNLHFFQFGKSNLSNTPTNKILSILNSVPWCFPFSNKSKMKFPFLNWDMDRFISYEEMDCIYLLIQVSFGLTIKNMYFLLWGHEFKSIGDYSMHTYVYFNNQIIVHWGFDVSWPLPSTQPTEGDMNELLASKFHPITIL